MSNPVGSFRPSLDDTYTPHTHTARPTPTTDRAQSSTIAHMTQCHTHRAMCTCTAHTDLIGYTHTNTHIIKHPHAHRCPQVKAVGPQLGSHRYTRVRPSVAHTESVKLRPRNTKGVMLRGTMACRAPGATAIHRSLRARRHEPLSPHASMECFHAARCVYPAITATSVPPHCRACPPAHLVSAVSSLLVGA